MKCPNKNTEEYKLLINYFGETQAYRIWLANGEELPSIQQIEDLRSNESNSLFKEGELTKNMNLLRDSSGKLMSSKNVDAFTNTLTRAIFEIKDNLTTSEGKSPKVSKMIDILSADLQNHFNFYNYYSENTPDLSDVEEGAFPTKEENKLVSEYYKHIIDNKDQYLDLVSNKINSMGYSFKKNSSIKEVIETEQDNSDYQEQSELELLEEGESETSNNFKDDATFQQNPFEKLSADVKRLLSFIPDNQSNIIGKSSYVPLETVYSSLLDILANKEITFEESIQEIQNNVISKPYLQEVVNLLSSSEIEEHTKNRFSSHFQNNNVSHVTQKLEQKGNTTVANIFNTNRNNQIQVLIEEWLVNSLNAPVFKPSNEGTIIDRDYVENQFKNQWNKLASENYNNVEEVQSFLKMVGIEMSLESLNYLKSNSKNEFGFEWNTLFTSNTGNATFKVIYNHIINTKDNTNIEEENPLNTEQQVTKLARIEVKFRDKITTDSFMNGENKSIFSFINPTWLINRFYRLINNKDKIRDTLSNLPLGRYSYWLQGLKNSEFFRKHFNVEVFDTLQNNKSALKFNKMSEREKLITQINLFINRQQGEGTNKISKFLTPSKSDKAVLHSITAQRYNVKSTKLDFDNRTFNDNDKEMLLNLVRGEYERIKDAQKKRFEGVNFDDIKGYNPFMFYNYPQLNDISELWVGGELIDYEDAEDLIWDVIKNDTYKQITDLKNKLDSLDIFNKKALHSEYFKDNSVEYFLADYIINYNIAVVNYNIMFQGDVAIAFKKNHKDSIDNMFKRLAKDIAPARRTAKLKANIKFQKYRQIFMKDAFSKSLNIEQLKIIFGNEERVINAYSSIEGTDAQELTTLKEHLDVMYNIGKIETKIYNDLSKKAKTKDYQFTEDELDIILQPMKPVYVGNKLMSEYGAEIPVYIKSSSFPLVPQLVKGTEFEKLERQLSKIRTDKLGKKYSIQRAVFLTGAKLGAFKPIDVWNKTKDENGEEVKFGKNTLTDGTFNEELIDKAISNGQWLELDRADFGIQQEVPYDADKSSILEGSQLSKLIFNGLRGKKETIDRFNVLHNTLIENSYQEFLTEIGAIENADGSYTFKDISNFAKLLESELKKRGGYTQNDLLSLELNDSKTDFKIPIWSSPKATQFESLLNSIINKRIIRQKLAGKSYVLGTEEGFLGKSYEINYIKEDQLVGTAYDKTTGLKPQRYGYIKGNQKLEESDYNNLEDKTGWNKVVFPAQILVAKGKFKGKQMIGYRIPTQDLNSMSAMEVVGYLPNYMGDLLIAPKDFTKQMGSDFDADKIYVHRWYETKNGKKYDIESINAEWNFIVQEKLDKEKDEEKITRAILKFLKVEEQDIDEEVQELIKIVLEKVPTQEEYIEKRKSKILKNEIVDIYWDTLTTIDNLPSILKPLDEGNLKEVKETLLEIEKENNEKLGITPISHLSPLYQIENYENGNAGKTGVSMTSLLSTFNALALASETDISVMKFDNKNKRIAYNFTINGEKRQITSLNASDKTLDDKSKKADTISAFQSVSVDNIKELVIKLINYNKDTHDAFVALSLFGLNDKYISYFLAQPAIKDYIKELQNYSDSFSENKSARVVNSSEAIYQKLQEQAKQEALENNSIPVDIENAIENWNSSFSEEDLLKALKKNDPYIQAVLLAKFLELSKVGKDIGKVVRSIQPATSGIGKNRIVANNKELMYEEVFNDPEFSITGLKGIINNTIAGKGIEILQRSNKLYNKFFKVNHVFNNLVTLVNNNRQTSLKSLTDKEQNELMNFTKSYLFSSSLNMYYGKDVQKYRDELLFGDNTLTQRWSNYKKENPESWLGQRIILKPSNSPTKPNRIEYRASQVDRTDDVRNISELIEMLESDNLQLRELAEDTIAYTYLTGGNQNAISLLKFIPVEYLNYTKFGQSINYSINKLEPSSLLEQFLQHNPYYAYTNTEEFIEEGNYLKHPEINVKYVSKQIEGKWFLYKRIDLDELGFVYEKIDNLGTFGVTETKFNTLNTESNFDFNKVNKLNITKETKSLPAVEEHFDSDIVNIEENIVGQNINIKLGVSELFESNPELANQVYEALGFKSNSIENRLQIFFNQFGFQFKEGDSSTDLLRKIIYVSKTDNNVFIDNSVKALSQLLLANTNIDFNKLENLIEDTNEFKTLLSQSSEYIRNTHKYLKDGNRIPMEEWVSYIKQYNKIKNTVLEKYVKESLLDKNNSTALHKLIINFLEFFKKLFNSSKNLKDVTDSLVQQVLLNQREVVINSNDLKNKEKVTLAKALKETSHGKDIIKTFGEFGLILTGSISAAEQGTVFRKTGKLLHDIDWVVPKGFTKDFNKKLKDTFEGTTLVREFDSSTYYTQTYIVPPKGYTISNLTFFKPEIYGKNKYIASYDVLDKDGNIVSNYRRYYDVKPSGKVIENREVYNEGLENVDKNLEAVSVDFFQNKEDLKFEPYTVSVEGVDLQLSNWMSSFTEKLKYGRAKDLLDYANFIPNDVVPVDTEITPQQKQQALQQYSQYLDTIFPDSKVKDIVYHGSTNANFESFLKNNKGLWFTTKDKADLYQIDRLTGKKAETSGTKAILLNISNPFVFDTTNKNASLYLDKLKNKESDALVGEDYGENSKDYVVFEPEQIHILGSKKDIEEFKKYVSKEVIGKEELEFIKVFDVLDNPIDTKQINVTEQLWSQYKDDLLKKIPNFTKEDLSALIKMQGLKYTEEYLKKCL